jgi:hypothetical protein
MKVEHWKPLKKMRSTTTADFLIKLYAFIRVITLQLLTPLLRALPLSIMAP